MLIQFENHLLNQRYEVEVLECQNKNIQHPISSCSPLLKYFEEQETAKIPAFYRNKDNFDAS